jgi:hypothetical protein
MIEDDATSLHASEMGEAIHDTITDDFVDEDDWAVRIDGERIIVEEV